MIDDFHSGQLMIPEFQRAYVWKANQASSLLDSLYKRYPIGSLLVWETTKKIAERGSNRQFGNTKTYWLIDGQQRITTLTKSLYSEGDIEPFFNLKDQAFTKYNKNILNNSGYIKISEIWNDNEYRKVRQRLDQNGEYEYLEYLDNVREILNYEIPIVYMIDHKF